MSQFNALKKNMEKKKQAKRKKRQKTNSKVAYKDSRGHLHDVIILL